MVAPARWRRRPRWAVRLAVLGFVGPKSLSERGRGRGSGRELPGELPGERPTVAEGQDAGTDVVPAGTGIAPVGGGAAGLVPPEDLAVRGTVLDPEGARQPDASLTLLAANGAQIARTTTGDDGRYTLPVPGSGAYIVVATSPALGAISHSVLVSDADVELDLRVEFPEAL